LPGLLRTIGRYVGIVRRQASEFRAQFDEAIKDTELDDIKRDIEGIRNDTQATMRGIEQSGEVRDTSDRDKRHGDPNYKPNYSEDELDWMNPDAAPNPAVEAAAAVARKGADASTTGTMTPTEAPSPSTKTTHSVSDSSAPEPAAPRKPSPRSAFADDQANSAASKTADTGAEA
ncbi:MAG: hypothetical protein AAFR23_01550, partial [Pseudomonadota bacterium]